MVSTTGKRKLSLKEKHILNVNFVCCQHFHGIVKTKISSKYIIQSSTNISGPARIMGLLSKRRQRHADIKILCCIIEFVGGTFLTTIFNQTT